MPFSPSPNLPSLTAYSLVRDTIASVGRPHRVLFWQKDFTTGDTGARGGKSGSEVDRHTGGDLVIHDRILRGDVWDG